MLSVIDSNLITLFQWIVRQFELYTEIQRKNLVDLTVLLMRTLLVVYITAVLFVFVMKITQLSSWVVPILLILSCYVCVDLSQEALKISKKRSNTAILPKEIVSRKSLRKDFLLIVTFFLIVGGLVEAYYSPRDFFDLVQCQGAFSCILAETSYLFLEYLICTTSLPPGEKQKRTEEREMKHLTPQRIRN